jgi:hypothetical protein
MLVDDVRAFSDLAKYADLCASSSLPATFDVKALADSVLERLQSQGLIRVDPTQHTWILTDKGFAAHEAENKAADELCSAIDAEGGFTADMLPPLNTYTPDTPLRLIVPQVLRLFIAGIYFNNADDAQALLDVEVDRDEDPGILSGQLVGHIEEIWMDTLQNFKAGEQYEPKMSIYDIFGHHPVNQIAVPSAAGVLTVDQRFVNKNINDIMAAVKTAPKEFAVDQAFCYNIAGFIAAMFT